MSATRRDFLKLASLAALGGCPGCATISVGGRSFPPRTLATIQATAGRNGGWGWAAWDGNDRVASWRLEASGPALSITKSVAALAVAGAAGEGWISPNELAAATIHEWRGDPRKSRITVQMLLQQTSGLEAGVRALYHNQPRDKGRAALALQAVDEPGAVFRYGPGHWETLAEIMRRKLAARSATLPDFLDRAVMRPIGLNPAKWRSDGRGIPYFSTGNEFTVEELCRLGRTLGQLLGGRNSAGISHRDFAKVARPSAANPMFGGGIWRNSAAPDARAISVERAIGHPLPATFWRAACLSTRQPASFAALIGSGGKRVYIWPGQDLGIGRLGTSSDWNDASFLGQIDLAKS